MQSTARRALIFGINGQDGSYLARWLIDHGYELHGTSRTARHGQNLLRLGIAEFITIHRTEVTDSISVRNLIDDIKPDEIYYLAGQSSVAESFAQPVETFSSNATGVLNVLEALRLLRHHARFFNSSSSEVFGDVSEPSKEDSVLAPCTPYGVAKATSALLVKTYRKSYGMFVCSGIMFNHESPLRPEGFVSQRIIHGAIDIAKRRKRELVLGNLTVVRDWGWAPDFAECMWLMLQQDRPDDYVISTGIGTSLAIFAEHAFRYFDLDLKEFVSVHPSLVRPADIATSIGSSAKAARQLGWKAKIVMPKLVDTLIEAALKEEEDKTTNTRVGA